MSEYTPQSGTQPEPVVIAPRESRGLGAEVESRSERLIALVGAGLATALVVTLNVVAWQEQAAPVVAEVAAVVPEVAPVLQAPTSTSPYATVNLHARAAVVYDVAAGKVLYEEQSREKLPLASLTKIMTSVVALESLRSDSHIAVSQNAIDTEGDSGLIAQERWNLKDLVSFTMLTSSNDGADALAASVGGIWQTTPETAAEYEKVDSFVGRMNLRAHELGLKNTSFVNPTGLDEPGGAPGAVGTAEDMAMLLAHAWREVPDALAHTDRTAYSFTSADGVTHYAENTNEYVERIPGLIGSKTGFTDLAGGNLAVMYNAGLDHPIVVVVLGSTREGRFEDVQTLVDATYDYVESGWYLYETAGSTEKG
jgi:D-alanyl-D-alanine carboxypeptidase (penicillin-binding protein 5/6)